MPSHMFRKSLIATALVCAFAAAPLSQVLAQDANGQMQKSADNQTVPDKAADGWITTKVKTELATVDDLKDSNISVETNDSVVMLSGTVASNAQKTRAVDAAKSVKGVKKVTTSGLMISATHDGSAMHNGNMPDKADHAMHNGSMPDKANHAMHDATSTPMRKTSDNETVPDKAADAWISTKVKAELATVDDLKDSNISVQTDDSVVTLSGTIASSSQKMRATKAAMSVKGVKKVVASGLMVGAVPGNNMVNKTDAAMHGAADTMAQNASDAKTVPDQASDAWITTKVKSELATAKDMKDSDISVETNNNAVMLTGTVASMSEKTRATKLAKSVKGVKKVDASGLTVSAMRSKTD